MPIHHTCVQFLKTICTSVLLMGYGEGHTGTKAKQTTNLPRSASSLLSRSCRSPAPRQQTPGHGRASNYSWASSLHLRTRPASLLSSTRRQVDRGRCTRPCHMLLDPYHTRAHWPPSLNSRGGRRPTPHAPNTAQSVFLANQQ